MLELARPSRRKRKLNAVHHPFHPPGVSLPGFGPVGFQRAVASGRGRFGTSSMTEDSSGGKDGSSRRGSVDVP